MFKLQKNFGISTKIPVFLNSVECIQNVAIEILISREEWKESWFLKLKI